MARRRRVVPAHPFLRWVMRRLVASGNAAVAARVWISREFSRLPMASVPCFDTLTDFRRSELNRAARFGSGLWEEAEN